MKRTLSKQIWQQCELRLKSEETRAVLHTLFEHTIDVLFDRISEVKADDGKSISFFTQGREFLTINVTRKDLRIYIHPKAGAYFDPKEKFNVERFRFWDASYHKTSGKYRAVSIWISQKKCLPGVKHIIDIIPKSA